MAFLRILALVLLTIPATGAHAGGIAELAFRPVPADDVQTCHHYENRARFKTHDSQADLPTVLAASCHEALYDLYVRADTNPFAAKRARIFLDRLTILKTTIIRINMERIFGQNYTRRSKPQISRLVPSDDWAPTSGPITASGEYLIAREIGVIAAFRDWSRATGFESAALH